MSTWRLHGGCAPGADSPLIDPERDAVASHQGALGTRRLADLVGADTARSLLETSRVFDADEALRLGFVTAVGEEPGWRETIEACAASACELPRDAHQALLSRTIPDTRDADMAALVTSVSRPGLRRRIEAFLSQSRQGR